MLSRISSHPNRAHFLAYAAMLVIFGAHITSLGPFIPYLAAASGLVETEYAFIFSCRSFGMLSGCFFIKCLQSLRLPVTNHQFMALGALSICLCFCMFTLTHSLFLQGMWVFFAGVSYAFFEIFSNICILMTSPPQEVEF